MEEGTAPQCTTKLGEDVAGDHTATSSTTEHQDRSGTAGSHGDKMTHQGGTDAENPRNKGTADGGGGRGGVENNKPTTDDGGTTTKTHSDEKTTRATTAATTNSGSTQDGGGNNATAHDDDSGGSARSGSDAAEGEEGGGGGVGREGGGGVSPGEVRVPREHGRLDALLKQIPRKAQHGLLMQCDLILTCIDVSATYVALGSNIGTAFLYHRHSHAMQRLRSETTSDVITCVALHEGLDHQVAVGTASGTLCIFFIPGPVSIHKRQLQKFDVRSVHSHYISCVEWSTNGMKLFSGDKTGHVVKTEVDFYQGECKSSLLLVERPTEIVQLSYDHRLLLVSTVHRSFLCRLDTTGHTVQIGQKDRKVQGSFGAVLIPGLCKVEDVQLYAVRPGCRVWLSDVNGNVLHTYIFKELLSMSRHDIALLQPAPHARQSGGAELQFGRLHLYGPGQLLTYNPSTLFILDPLRNQVVGSQSQLGGIVDVAVHEDEVFVLRRHKDSAVIRIAHQPEALGHTVVCPGMPMDLPASTTNDSGTKPGSSNSSNPADRQGDREEESKAKGFFKKTFFSPFKKLENFIEERTQAKEKEPPPEPDLRPIIRSDPHQTPSPPEPDLPPVVPLDSPDLMVRVFKGSGGTPVDIQSPDSAHSALSVFAEEVGEKGAGAAKVTGEEVKVMAGPQEEGGAGEGEPEPPSTQDADNQDIVFTHQMHKKKAKKKKAKGLKADKDSDSISQSSVSSQGVGEERKGEGGGGGVGEQKTDDVLRRAEQALHSVDRLLKEEGGGGKKGASKANDGGGGGGGAMVGEGHTRPSQGTGAAVTQGRSPPPTQQAAAVTPGQPAPRVPQKAPPSRQDAVDSATPGQVVPASAQQSTADPSHPATTHATLTAHGSPQASASPGPPTTAPHGVSAGSGGTQSPARAVVPPASIISNPDHAALHTDAHAAKGGADPLEAAERELDSMTQRHKKPVKQESVMAEDFYNMFAAPYSPTNPLEYPPPLTSASSFSSTTTQPSAASSRVAGDEHRSMERQRSEGSVREISMQRIANNWSEHTTPANIYSLALSASHVWFTDKSDHLYYSALGGVKGIVWRKVGESASQVSVSPSGHIVWRLHRGRAFAGTKITQRRPEGLKWVEAVNNVAYISVDDTCAWYVKTSGEVMMQRGLSKERPCFRSLAVESEVGGVKQVLARYGVVWALNDSMALLVRTGISPETPQGLAWHTVTRQTEPYLFSSVTVDSEGVGWAVDVVGQIWFTDQVTPQNPVGSGKWWQVPLSEYFVQDPSVLDMIRTMAKKRLDTQKLSHILSTRRGGLIAAGNQGVWVSLDYLNTLHVCHSSLQGYHWSAAQPFQMAESTTWKQVAAAMAHLTWGLVWAQQVNGDLYAIPGNSSDATLVPTPAPLVSLGVNGHGVWGLSHEGELLVRTGMGPHCPLGVDWATLDLLQLADTILVHVSCNDNYVWVVDADGRVFHRIGAAAPRQGQLNPAWLPIDVYTEIIFTKVITGPLEWMVWAVDNRRLTYVRVGVGEDLPIGKEWVHVPGIQAMDLCVSGSGVWALDTNGEILFRYGITPQNLSGNYWKKIPGCFTRISASSEDVLWAVNTSGQLVKCGCRLLLRRQDSGATVLHHSISSNSEDGEWELV